MPKDASSNNPPGPTSTTPPPERGILFPNGSKSSAPHAATGAVTGGAYDGLLGAQPPHSNDAEVAVLGALMLERDAIRTVGQLLDHVAFYREAHRYIYQAIQQLHERGEPADLITLNDELRRSGRLKDVGGSYYLSTVLGATPTAANVEHHARIVYEHHLRRQLREIGLQVLAGSVDVTRDVFDQIELLRAAADGLLVRDRHERVDEVYKRADVLADVAEAAFDEGASGSIATGFYQLDRLMGGLKGGELIVIAGRPGSGKTALAITLALHLSGLGPDGGAGVPTVLFELEMARNPTWFRVLAQLAQLDVSRFGHKANNWTKDEGRRILEGLGRVEKAPLYIDTYPYYTVPMLRNRLRQLRDAGRLHVAIIDYPAKMPVPRGHSKTDEIEYVFSNLKAMAKEFNIPIVALSQLNRSCESRNPPRPMLSDLRDSGSIEQEADVVLMCYRPEYYRDVQYEDGSTIENMGDIQIEKNRNGPVGAYRFGYLKQYAQWVNPVTRW